MTRIERGLAWHAEVAHHATFVGQSAPFYYIARKHLEDATLHAPLEGFIASRSLQVGEIASPGRPAAVIAALAIPVTVTISLGALHAIGVPLHQVSIAALM